MAEGVAPGRGATLIRESPERAPLGETRRSFETRHNPDTRCNAETRRDSFC